MSNSPTRTTSSGLEALADLIERNKHQLMSDWRAQVSKLPAAQRLDEPTLNDLMPKVLDELSRALRSGYSPSVLDVHLKEGPRLHGLERLHVGFDIVEVVAEYNILQELVQNLAEQENLDLTGDANRVINRVFGRGIAAAVDTYAREKAVEVQQRREEHIAFIVHDLRTPLAAIETGRAVLARSIPEDIKSGAVADMLAVLQRNTTRVKTLLKDVGNEQQRMILATQRKHAERRELDLWPVVEQLFEELLPLLRQPGVRFVNDVARDLVVYADALMLEQILQNLLSNAVRYTATGEIVVGAKQDGTGRSSRIWVRDTGSGIEPERIGKIFNKLETDGQHEGSLGLGLSIVQQLVEAHGGEVLVESVPGQGSTFTFTLPDKA
jgi:signal transduction histidine kinase